MAQPWRALWPSPEELPVSSLRPSIARRAALLAVTLALVAAVPFPELGSPAGLALTGVLFFSPSRARGARRLWAVAAVVLAGASTCLAAGWLDPTSRAVAAASAVAAGLCAVPACDRGAGSDARSDGLLHALHVLSAVAAAVGAAVWVALGLRWFHGVPMWLEQAVWALCILAAVGLAAWLARSHPPRVAGVVPDEALPTLVPDDDGAYRRRHGDDPDLAERVAAAALDVRLTRALAIVSALFLATAPALGRAFDLRWSNDVPAWTSFRVESKPCAGCSSFVAVHDRDVAVPESERRMRWLGLSSTTPLGYEETTSSRPVEAAWVELVALGVHRLGDGTNDRLRDAPGTSIRLTHPDGVVGTWWIPGAPCVGASAILNRRACALERRARAHFGADDRHAAIGEVALPRLSTRVRVALPVTRASLEAAPRNPRVGPAVYFDLYGGIVVGHLPTGDPFGREVPKDVERVLVCSLERVGDTVPGGEETPIPSGPYGAKAAALAPRGRPVPLFRAAQCTPFHGWSGFGPVL